jgi:hypothetical protein
MTLDEVQSLHNAAMEHAEAAQRAIKAGHLDAAGPLFDLAMAHERLAAEGCPAQPWRGILQRSAAHLALSAGDPTEAARIARAGLADPTTPRGIRIELYEVTRKADPAPLQQRLDEAEAAYTCHLEEVRGREAEVRRLEDELAAARTFQTQARHRLRLHVADAKLHALQIASYLLAEPAALARVRALGDLVLHEADGDRELDHRGAASIGFGARTRITAMGRDALALIDAETARSGVATEGRGG